VSPPMLKPQTAGSHLFRRIASMSAKISVAPPVGVVDFSKTKRPGAGYVTTANWRAVPTLPAAVLVRWPSTARRTWAMLRLSAAGAWVDRAGQGSDGSERAAEVGAPA
jgi:hypothetical protein